MYSLRIFATIVLLIAFGPAAAAQSRWTQTAIQSGPLGLGDPTSLSWAIVPDGTPVEFPPGPCPCPTTGPTRNSDLIQTLGSAIVGTTLEQILNEEFARWQSVTGIDFTHLTNDTGETISNNCSINSNPPNPSLILPGVPNVRADIRIAGRIIDGGPCPQHYARTYPPDHGDIIIDTSYAAFLADPTNDFRRLRNMIAHEIGHAIGLDHVCPVSQTKLMEPALSTSFLGPQLDDIIRAQRLYGDPDEDNDSATSATPLGTLGPTTLFLLNRSTESLSDHDYYAFSTNVPVSATITVFPAGGSYLFGSPSGGVCGPPAPTPAAFNSTNVQKLALEVLDGSGQSLGVSAALNYGDGASSNLLLPAGGPHRIHVYATEYNSSQSTPSVYPQIYDLTATLSAAPSGPPIGPWIVATSSPPGAPPVPDGSFAAPFLDPQDGISAAANGQTVIVLPGAYTYFITTLDFLGKDIVVRSLTGPETTSLIMLSSAIVFSNGESSLAVLHGFSVDVAPPISSGGLFIMNASPTISNCGIFGLTSPAPVTVQGGSPRLVNCTISGSEVEGLAVSSGASVTITNCTIISNSNAAGYPGGVTVSSASSLAVQNSIVWGNHHGFPGPEIVVFANGVVTVDHSFIGLSAQWPSPNNSNAFGDPGFANGSTFYSFPLSANSAARDIGTAFAPGIPIPATDIEGKSRFYGPPDAGAYEYVDTCGAPPIIVCYPGGVGNGSFSFSLPGTDDQLRAFTLINGLGEPFTDLKHLYPGQEFEIFYFDGQPTPTFGPAPFIVGFEAYNPQFPGPTSSFPAIHLDPAIALVITEAGLPPTGRTIAFPYNGGLAGIRGRTQGFVLSPFAANGLGFAASPAMEVEFH